MADVKMETLVSLCKRRGFIFQSSDIYGGLNGVYDYGPLGSILKNNIRDFWWREMTQIHDNIVGIDASILMHRKVWEASGHVSNFTDPLVDCKSCKSRFRADQIDLKAPCPVCGNKGTFTTPRNFNLMFTTHIGSTADDDTSLIYLRPETAQGIYVNFKNVVDSSRVKVPFGIAQVGKSFRNEITTKNFIFRSCEFEQMEMQWFCKPGDDDKWFSYWKQQRIDYYTKLGIRPENLRFHKHGDDELAFYAKEAFDIQYNFPMGWQELEGIHNRTNYDLTQHSKFSGKDLNYFDQESDERYIPYIIETSAGLTRNLLMVLSDAYEEEELDGGDKRVVLHFHPNIAPVKVAVLPLVKKDGLAERARDIEKSLRKHFVTDYDQNVAIGKRYRRQDEIGTPYCITIDYDTLKDDTVTLRLRDSMKQERIKVADIVNIINKEDENYKRK